MTEKKEEKAPAPKAERDEAAFQASAEAAKERNKAKAREQKAAEKAAEEKQAKTDADKKKADEADAKARKEAADKKKPKGASKKLLDELAGFEERLDEALADPENYTVYVRSALLNILGELSHLRDARETDESLERAERERD